MKKNSINKMYSAKDSRTPCLHSILSGVVLNPLTEFGKAPIFLANVTFEPGCRNNWHIHRATKGGGQMLICTPGEGWYQEEGKEAKSLAPGTVITIPANVKHWHGAKADSWFRISLRKCRRRYLQRMAGTRDG
jgi:quercetin dioxygenase-like cupin family protein